MTERSSLDLLLEVNQAERQAQLDTLELMLQETRSVLELKSRKLKWALMSLSGAALLTALQLVVI